MTKLLKIAASFLYEVLFDANPFDSSRKQEAFLIDPVAIG